jgi:hypothetical protein
MLIQINERLNQIMAVDSKSDTTFGGLSVIAVGDLHQCQPVKANWIFQDPVQDTIVNVPAVHLWKSMFTMRELTMVQRQESDSEFCTRLNEVRVAALNNLVSSQCVKYFRQRLTKQSGNTKGPDLSEPVWRDAVRLFAKNHTVNDYNSTKLQELLRRRREAQLDEGFYTWKSNVVENRRFSSRRSRQLPPGQSVTAVHQYDKVMDEQDARNNGGISYEAFFAIGSRVMIRRNQDTSDGLVNGVCGEVVAFEWEEGTEPGTAMPVAICMKPDSAGVGRVQRYRENRVDDDWVRIRPATVEKDVDNSKFQITGYCLQLAWAITIHKSQGLTLERAVVDVGPDCFDCGLAYVALSRVRRFEDLAILNIDRSKLICDMRVVEYMRTLRENSATDIRAGFLSRTDNVDSDDSDDSDDSGDSM